MARGAVLSLALLLAMIGTAVSASAQAWAPSADTSPGGQDLTDETRRIAQELQCPICEGLSVADSPSQLATQMRGVIRDKLAAGESREAILKYFVDRYGESILMAPPRTGFTSVVWVAPWLALLATLGFLGWKLRRNAQAPEPTGGTDPALTPFYDEVDRTYEAVRDEAIR